MEEKPRSLDDHELSLPDPENKLTSSPESSQEVASQEISEKSLAVEALDRQPVTAFEHAAKSAETDKPLEKVYEMRHEVKDESASNAAVSVGQVLADRPQPDYTQPHPLYPSTSGSPSPQQSAEPPSVQISPQPSLYRRAIISGFLAAVAIMMLFVLIQLLS